MDNWIILVQGLGYSFSWQTPSSPGSTPEPQRGRIQLAVMESIKNSPGVGNGSGTTWMKNWEGDPRRDARGRSIPVSKGCSYEAMMVTMNQMSRGASITPEGVRKRQNLKNTSSIWPDNGEVSHGEAEDGKGKLTYSLEFLGEIGRFALALRCARGLGSSAWAQFIGRLPESDGI
jgi:hypothetical protein